MTHLPQKALSIRQPWAWAIAYAGKDIENRSWATKYRGPICIHAAKGCTFVEFTGAIDSIRYAAGDEMPIPPLGPAFIDRGGIIGTAEIVDCVDYSDSPWFFGPYGLVLRNVQPVDFIPVKGALGLFDWRKNLETPHG